MKTNLREFYKNSYLYDRIPYIHEFTPSGKVSGAIFAISTIENAIPILHGSSGCGFHYKYVCRRSWKPAYNLKCTGLKEKDIIMGGSEKLKKTILETVKKYNPSLIGIIPASSIDVTNDDIEGVIREIQPLISCKLIFVKSKKISHADKRSNARKSFCENNTNKKKIHDGNLKSCGFSEAMEEIVQKVMKPQEVDNNLINICGFYWGINEDAMVNGMKKEFEKMGIKINSFIPNCSVEELETAPRATLNIITSRVKWVMKMKELYGTEFMVVRNEDYSYSGLDGIEEFYLDVAKKIGAYERLSEYLNMRKVYMEERLKKQFLKLCKYTCVIYCEDFRNIGKLINFYGYVLKLKIKYIAVTVKQNRYMSLFSENQLFEMAKENIIDGLSKLDYEVSWKINFNNEETITFEKDADICVGDISTKSSKHINPPAFIPLDFDNYEKFIHHYIDMINRTALNEKRGFPLDNYNKENVNEEVSKKMWDILWLQRGGKKYEL
ncbi:nitrogenase component 1 [Clostridium sp.]|uniref:nitrogenase component 1 n=1 Tax=Clostridium sp. TaxID=1506 RepID=UPI00261CB49E|nr:nitrogenase component 1 [Clostridium sp.]